MDIIEANNDTAGSAVPATALFLRTVSADHKSYGGFQWPNAVGAVVTAPDWSPEPVCGKGLHGLMWGEGDATLLCADGDAVWQVVEAVESASVCLSGKRKFASCTIRYIGDRDGAVHYILSNGGAGRAVAYCTATAGYSGTATAGDSGTATAGYSGTATAGNRGTATAGTCGTATAGDRGTATAGTCGTATAGNRGTATAGDRGTATAGDSGTATAGDSGTATAGYSGTATAGNRGTATAGDRGTATAGNSGTLILKWYDGNRYRITIGYVGENGIEAYKPYITSGDGTIVGKN